MCVWVLKQRMLIRNDVCNMVRVLHTTAVPSYTSFNSRIIDVNLGKNNALIK